MGGPGSGRKPYTNAVCGTRAKYQYHRKRKEHCQMCLDAATEWSRKQKGSKVGTPRYGVTRLPPSVRKQARKNWLIAQKLSRVACIECGIKVTAQNTYMFHYHHRDPKLKTGEIGKVKHHWTIDRLLEEMDKCDLICSNCHSHYTDHQQKTGILTGYRKDRAQQQTMSSHDSVLTLF
jgi:hypothetical protein